MRLTLEQVDIIVRVRSRLTRERSSGYICIEIMEYTTRARQAELNRWKNRLFFWRRYDIHDKWANHREKLLGAIRFGLRMHPTMGEWLHAETYGKDIKFPPNMNNNTLYMLARLAWLDKIIETGRIQ
jgi:hypothetical protein